MDGHFLHGTWTFSTSRTLGEGAPPVVSGRRCPSPTSTVRQLAVFSHGHVVELAGEELAEVDAHWTSHYGSSPLSWGDVVMWRLEPSWMVGYAFRRTDSSRSAVCRPERRPTCARVPDAVGGGT